LCFPLAHPSDVFIFREPVAATAREGMLSRHWTRFFSWLEIYKNDEPVCLRVAIDEVPLTSAVNAPRAFFCWL